MNDSCQQAQDVYTIQVRDGQNLFPDPELDSPLKIPNLFKTQLSCQECITLLVGDPVQVTEGSSNTSSASVAIPWNNAISSGGLVTHVHKALQRQVSGYLGGKFAQHLVDYFLVVLRISPGDKSAAERGHDASNNRWRRYKQSASLDSRKVVLFFSILSSMGTLVLIYLTLRVRQIGA